MDSLWTENSKIYPVGIPIAHSWLDVGAILKIIQDYKIHSFIEIGVDSGGLAALIIVYGANVGNLIYTGVEIKQMTNPHITVQSGSIYSMIDVFSEEGYQLLSSIIDKSVPPRFIYCDNGDKVREFEQVAPLIEAGDYIACHDFGNEFDLTDFSDMPPTIARIETSWLDDTNIILFGGIQ